MIVRLSPALVIVFRRKLIPITSDNLRTHRGRVSHLLLRLFPRLP